MSRTLLLILPAVVLAGCATLSVSKGTHLVYRDANGNVTRQFDYPSNDTCRKVEAVAGPSARCQEQSVAANLAATATLRYNPPGIMVSGHYASLDRCRTDTGTLAEGVQLVDGCKAK